MWLPFDPAIVRIPESVPDRQLPHHLSAERAGCLNNRGHLDILDLGCGRAPCRQYFVERGHRYVGLDLRRDYATVCGEAQQLPFRDATFDAVLSTAALHYMLRPDLVFDESFRVLRAGGTITGSAPFLEPWRWGGCVQLSPQGLILLLERSGFTVTHLWPGWEGAVALNEVAFEPWPSLGVWLGRCHSWFFRTWWTISGSWQSESTATLIRQLQVAASINFHATKH